DGWHNNHHAYPVSARHGLRWYEIDFNWYAIWILKQFGLVSHIHRAEWSGAKLTLRERNATAGH
ncbi:MAG TPA: acyl-CoA desaturase, partial [Candidatus Sulfotelmatobacter sp.]